MANLELEQALDVARNAVKAAADASLRYFGRSGGELGLTFKPDQSPVTLADQAAEEAILKVIRAHFPDHQILTEESGVHAGRDTRYRWIIDPLDGTRGFSRGGSHWGPLIALEVDGEVVVGATCLPPVGQHYWAARGLGTFRDGTKLTLSSIDRWEAATLSLGEIHKLLTPELAPVMTAIATSCASTRSYGDVAGCTLLLDGRADAWIEAGVQIWDLAPHKILVEEAGGIFTDLNGNKTISAGHCLAANSVLHAQLLSRLVAR